MMPYLWHQVSLSGYNDPSGNVLCLGKFLETVLSDLRF